ncbi:hypothetical protein K469DRAFT_708860 [Zopfia rhizophila CBS 207.26]|uniref:Reverse transcriptase domain-containing protein n=1 Tax=Zopfia rhizophila CBS 207.26 TaxID=1314779 RepID=A0A6A6E2F6_9PEZI|nr:hypothetical protein K469DRAFT_708860 [Zopfia rhizophila CBS 207.26]
MSAEPSFLSQTLQSITTTKMREQDKRRRAFKEHKAEVLEAAQASPDQRARLEVLLSGFKHLSSSNKGVWYVDSERKNAVRNVSRYLEQSQHDPSVSLTVLRGFEDNFRQKLDQESQRYDFADLYYRLLAEWTDARSEPIVNSEDPELDGPFEHVQRYNLQRLKDKFSSVVFTPLETDEVEIDAYMSSLFEDDHAADILQRLREGAAAFGRNFKERSAPFNSVVLKSCIQALLTNDLLNDAAKMTLSEFSQNDVVLDEIADVLNLRFSDIDNWSWEADEGMYYEPRRQGNGKYRIMMDQDILQALFLHYIAVSWCAEFKGVFRRLPFDSKFWKGFEKMSAEQVLRRYYFTGVKPSSTDGIEQAKANTFRTTFFLSSLPESLTDGSDPYGEDNYKDPNDDSKTGLGIRQMLLRQIATDVIIRRSLHGDVAVVQSDLQWYATGLPHTTLFAVLRFWGVPEDWIKFFRKFAEAPLRMSETPGENVRTRKRGIPITDAFEKLFGECVLFAMDVAVNRIANMTLIRFHDDLWLSGDPSQCASAWQTIESLVKVLGLDMNSKKTGSVYFSYKEKDAELAAKFPKGPVCMGMLKLTDEGQWTIDTPQVDKHRRQLQKQLGQCTSILSWVQTWNACMGKFFQTTFGKPANCFGQGHVDAILQTHARMQRELFDQHNGSVTEYLRELFSRRFAVKNIPDSFFFLPEEFGGLGLQNPFIPFFILKDQLMKDPLDRIREFEKAEKRMYKEDGELFFSLSDAKKRQRFKKADDGNTETSNIVTEKFFSFEEYTRCRETYSPLLRAAYVELMQKPSVQDVRLTDDIKPWFDELGYSHGMGWGSLTSENKWIMHLYAEELMKRFGALSIVDQNLLPSGVMKMLRKKKVTWQLILWD